MASIREDQVARPPAKRCRNRWQSTRMHSTSTRACSLSKIWPKSSSPWSIQRRLAQSQVRPVPLGNGNSYVNRAGKTLSVAERARLEKAKDELRKLFQW